MCGTADSVLAGMNELQREIHEINVSKGWWRDPYTDRELEGDEKLRLMAEKIHMNVTEACEATDELRKVDFRRDPLAGEILRQVYYQIDEQGQQKPCGLGPELADEAIRVMDEAEAAGIDLGEMIKLKMAYNRQRAMRHGGKSL